MLAGGDGESLDEADVDVPARVEDGVLDGAVTSSWSARFGAGGVVDTLGV